MKKAGVCVVVALLFALLLPDAASLRERGTQALEIRRTAFEEELGAGEVENRAEVTLYFRYGSTSLLGAQRMRLDMDSEETIARRIVDALVAGPDVAHQRLSGLFPQGTRVISVTGDSTTIFVTLSRELLDRPDGAPADWEDNPVWDAEATARRLLAAQSIVLALTENARCQRVQLYIADSDDDVPERMPLAWFDANQPDNETVLTACGRDESYLLTPERALRLILDSWQRRDWDGVYNLLSLEETLPAPTVFAAQMEEMGVSLISYSVTPGTVDLFGERATMVLDALIRSDEGGDARLTREVVPLRREHDNWTLSADALTRLMIRD